jgi:hypothetical protein
MSNSGFPTLRTTRKEKDQMLRDLILFLAYGYFAMLFVLLGITIGERNPPDRRDAEQIERDERETRKYWRERDEREKREYMEREAEYEREQQREREYEREQRERGYIERCE